MIKLYLLKDKPEYIDKVADINFNTWIDFYKDNQYEDITNIEEYKEYLRDNCKLIDKFPINIIMINEKEDSEYIGSVSLLDDDFPEIARDKIWITELFVDPNYRNKGAGKLLIQAALDTAKDCKLKEVYLACFEDLIFYYKKLNFNYTGNQIFYANKKYYIFKYKL